MDFTHKFHEVTYEPTLYGPDDTSSAIALDFAGRSRQTSQRLSVAGKELAEAAQDLALAIGEGAAFKEVGNCQERYQKAAEKFEGLHRKWVAQSTSALSVFRDYWTRDQD
ncbi:hypothetical protein [Streptomyces asiaticus]|uniref:hypothetical protein n=1 Tax=Streptomyces asiaticus TaxID=114695 RepID=UPI0037FCBD48